jgi:hypothetical protein
MNRIVVSISLDGLAVDILNDLIKQNKIKCLSRFVTYSGDGVGTLNARTDAYATVTLPNHMGMFTGRGTFRNSDHNDIVIDDSYRGHQTIDNVLPDENGHEIHHNYLESIFDIMYASQMRPRVYAGKSKFGHLDNTYKKYKEVHYKAFGIKFNPEDDPLEDVYIDEIYRETPLVDEKYTYYNPDTRKIILPESYNLDGFPLLNRMLNDLLESLQNPDFKKVFRYIFFHFRGADSVGHQYGWSSENYKQAVIAIDQDLGYLMNKLIDYHILFPKYNFYVLVTSDHGGGLGTDSTIGEITDKNHDLIQIPVNHTVIFGLWRTASPISHYGEDFNIYKYFEHNMNPKFKNIITEPKINKALIPDMKLTIVPIDELKFMFDPNGLYLLGPLRNLYVGNLASALLGLIPIPESWGGVYWKDKTRTNGEHIFKFDDDPINILFGGGNQYYHEYLRNKYSYLSLKK